MDQFLSIIFFDARLGDARRRLPPKAGSGDRRDAGAQDRPSRQGSALLRP